VFQSLSHTWRPKKLQSDKRWYKTNILNGNCLLLVGYPTKITKLTHAQLKKLTEKVYNIVSEWVSEWVTPNPIPISHKLLRKNRTDERLVKKYKIVWKFYLTFIFDFKKLKIVYTFTQFQQSYRVKLLWMTKVTKVVLI